MEVSLLNRTISYVIYGVIALGILGLFSELFKNPFGLLMNIVIIAAIAGIVYLVYTRLTQGKTDRKEQRAFRKAVRHSKKRSKDRAVKKSNVTNMTPAKAVHKIKPRKKSDVQLTVIEGKKSKKKNRASF
jgi:hypothetical protein